MMGAIYRWQIWLPRLLGVAIVLLAVQWLLGLATRSAVRQFSAEWTRSTVELRHARVSVLTRQIVLRDLRVADPRHASRNLVEADHCELHVAAGPLLWKRAVVDRGSVTGLRFGTPRGDAADGATGAGPTSNAGISSFNWATSDPARSARDWLDRLGQQYDGRLVEQLSSVRRATALRNRWPELAAGLRDRVRRLASRADELHHCAEAAAKNPLRHAESLSAAADESLTLQREYDELAADIERLPELVEVERNAIAAARSRDTAWLRRQLRISSVDAESLSAYLLCEQAARPVDELIGWLRLVRRLVPAEPCPPAAGGRGNEILFAGTRPYPKLLVRELELDGTCRIGGQPVNLCGALTGFASSQTFADEPLRLKLTTRGSLPLVLQATIDRSRRLARDEYVVDGRGIVVPQADLGDAERLRLALAQSVGELSVSVIVDGDALNGELQLVQKRVPIATCIGSRLSGVPIERSLHESLGEMAAVATRVSLSGTLQEPTCRMWSNLGAAVAEALEQALPKAAEERTQALVVEAGRRIDAQLVELEHQMASTRTELLPQIARVAGRLQQLAVLQQAPNRITPQQLGRRLPANSLFR